MNEWMVGMNELMNQNEGRNEKGGKERVSPLKINRMTNWQTGPERTT